MVNKQICYTSLLSVIKIIDRAGRVIIHIKCGVGIPIVQASWVEGFVIEFYGISMF